MRKIIRLAWNDIRIEFSDRVTLIFFLVLPLLFTAIVGAALGSANTSDTSGDNRFPVLLVDEDHSALAQELMAALDASEVVRPEIKTAAEAESLFADQEAPAIVTLPAGLGAAVLAGQPVSLHLKAAPEDNRVVAVQEAVSTAASQVGSAVAAARASLVEAEKIRPFDGEAARAAYFEQGLTMAREALKQPPARIETTQGATVTAQMADGFEQSSPGQLVTWVLITLIGAAEVFVNERLGGTLRRLVVTPTSKAAILSGKVAGRLAMGIVQMILLIGFGALVFRVNWGRSPLALALIVVAFALAAVALGVLLGTFARTRSQAAGLTVLFSMLTAALGGAWWPLEVTPPVYQTVVKALPTTWAMIGFTDVIVRGQGVAGVLPEVAILLAFAVAFFAIGIWRFKYE